MLEWGVLLVWVDDGMMLISKSSSSILSLV